MFIDFMVFLRGCNVLIRGVDMIDDADVFSMLYRYRVLPSRYLLGYPLFARFNRSSLGIYKDRL